MSNTNKIIGHIDADCFYVSCERARNPFLNHKPVGVLGNQGACVIAKSYELKPFGVKVGEPIWETKKKCPQTIFVKRDFYWYEVLSRQILNLLKKRSNQVEYYSIDEMFFDATDLPVYYGCTMEKALQHLQQDVLQEVGIPTSIGVSKSKTLAKLASDCNKPFGTFYCLDQARIEYLLSNNPVDEICGIGGKSASKLHSYGIHTCLDFVASDRHMIKSLLTKAGEGLWWELCGICVSPIQTQRATRLVVARGGSMQGTHSDKTVLYGWLTRNLERLCDALQHLDLMAGELSLKYYHKQSGKWRARTTLPHPMNSFDDLMSVLHTLFTQITFKPITASYMHIVSSNLQLADRAQQSLFEQKMYSDQPLEKAVKEINKQFGRFTVRRAGTAFINDLYHDKASNYEICDIHGKIHF